ncbi:MAG TPA: hypothetical protein PLJ60_00465 [Chryseolinea sp.]|nr:hypothetical protein [Chryseolinea sp.]HPH46114.1 hypothetical protein [Chryseolinea sp.]HPM28779.1 hypothetical protein [Chryseolinea sp.]
MILDFKMLILRTLILLLVFSYTIAHAQITIQPKEWIDQLNLKGGLPEKLLSTRSVVFYSYTMTAKEIKDVQESFQRTGIDAIVYFELDKLIASRDVTRTFSNYLESRDISNLVFVEKRENDFRLTLTPFNKKESMIDNQQNAWSLNNSVLTEALKELYRTAANQQKKQNLLINDVAEMDFPINPIVGRRNEFYASDLKVDPLSVPKTGIEEIDKQLEEIFTANYPLKFKLTEPGLSEKDLRKQGSLYVLCFIYARVGVAKSLLGYDMSKSESALVSVTYPNGQQQLKNFPSDTMVFKFYFKHIDSGNVFLGNKWDADLTWQEALLNQIKGMKAELRIN